MKNSLRIALAFAVALAATGLAHAQLTPKATPFPAPKVTPTT